MLPPLVPPRRDEACDAIGAAGLPFMLSVPSDAATLLSPTPARMSLQAWLGALALLASILVPATLWGPRVETPDAWPERPISVALVFAPPAPEPATANSDEAAPPRAAEPMRKFPPAIAPAAPPAQSASAPTLRRRRAVADPHGASAPAPPPAAAAGSRLPIEQHLGAVARAAPASHVVAPPRPVAGAAANPKPVYPPQAAQRGWQGTVLLHVAVSAAGRPISAIVLTSSGHGILDECARSTVLEKWRFEPATEDGTPITGEVNIPIQFRLTL
jgi:protein TonB